MPVSASQSVGPHIDIQARVNRLGKLAELLDSAVAIPGTKWTIGLDPIVGLVPGLGDAITAGFSLYIVVEASRLGARRRTVMRMLGNVAIDFLVGAIPILGDIFDGIWKCNIRNLRILERALGQRSD